MGRSEVVLAGSNAAFRAWSGATRVSPSPVMNPTQRPELYQAVVCWHPLLDMLCYDEFMEAQQFKWLYAYSPYHHVKPGQR
jgi:hypothetical protein